MTRRTLIAALFIALSLMLAGCSMVGSALQKSGTAVSRAGAGLQGL
jgi:starvation-inducible outer membrane lipoprotein